MFVRVSRRKKPPIRASEFIAGDKEQMEQLRQMGIRIVTLGNGMVQLQHTAAEVGRAAAAAGWRALHYIALYTCPFSSAHTPVQVGTGENRVEFCFQGSHVLYSFVCLHCKEMRSLAEKKMFGRQKEVREASLCHSAQPNTHRIAPRSRSACRTVVGRALIASRCDCRRRARRTRRRDACSWRTCPTCPSVRP